MGKLIYKQYPDGTVVKYGLRDFDPSRLSRQWQRGIAEEFRTGKPCGFHTFPEKQPVLTRYPNLAGGMILQGATHKSHELHGLVRPMHACWSESQIRSLGGGDCFLQICETVFAPVIRKAQYFRIVHYNGAEDSAASEADFHIHGLTNPDPIKYLHLKTDAAMRRRFLKSKLVLMECGSILVVVESLFQVGQVQFVQTNLRQPVNIEDLITAFVATKQLFDKAFSNTFPGKEGMAPDGQFEADFLDGRLHLCSYIPMLAGVGIEQKMRRPSPHQWTPERTLQLLEAAR